MTPKIVKIVLYHIVDLEKLRPSICLSPKLKYKPQFIEKDNDLNIIQSQLHVIIIGDYQPTSADLYHFANLIL
jgi:hypothetical protein